MNTPSASIVLDKREKMKGEDGRFPIAIRIGLSRNDNRKWNIGGTFFYTEKEFESITNPRNKNKFKDLLISFDEKVRRAESIIEEMMPNFSYVSFKERFFVEGNWDVKIDKSSLVYVCEHTVLKYRKRQQYPMTIVLIAAMRSILKYTKTKNLPMKAITPEFCRDFEAYMFAKSKTKTRNGAGIALRHIRIFFNEGIRSGLISKDWYPFKKKYGELSKFDDPYVIPNERKTKDYLTEEQIVQFESISVFENESQEIAHWAWLASFYCNGSNAADYLSFKYSDIQGNFIYFYREKIKNTSRTDKHLIKVFLSPELRELIKRYGNAPHPDNYIFPVFENGMSEEQIFSARKCFATRISKSLKFLAANNQLNFVIRLGNARHSLANMFKKNKVDREIAKDIFGHKTLATLDNYYSSFPDEDHERLVKSVMSLSSIKSRVVAREIKSGIPKEHPAMVGPWIDAIRKDPESAMRALKAQEEIFPEFVKGLLNLIKQEVPDLVLYDI